MHVFAHRPAAGAPLEDLVLGALVGLAAIAVIAVLAIAHRTGRIRLLARLGKFAEQVSGLPPWAALPAGITAVALLTAVFGFYWDVATHIDNGRDPGPFANPSHYLIIVGLAGCALAGFVAIVLGRAPHRSAIRVRDGWYAPIGGVLLLLCGGVAVIGFPLDDVWHRLFGQDVTLWSPTHLQMVGGAALSTLALWVLVVEGRREARSEHASSLRWVEMLVAGSFLIGLSALQAEFDYSVPQFRLLYHPVLLMASAGTALVAARMRLGRGAALTVVALFLAVRALVSVLVGPVMGHTTLHFPLYLVEALVVEAVALFVSPARQFNFAALCGVAIGTVGLAAEWAWSHVWMTMSWPASLGPEAVVLALLAATSGSMVGAFIGRALLEPGAPRQRASFRFGLGVAAVTLFALAYPFPTNGDLRGTATITVIALPDRDGWVRLHVELDPPSAARDSEWFVVTAWQGGGSVVEELRPLGHGRYISRSVPVHGEWKTLLRLHDDRDLMAVPVYLPADPAIPAPAVALPDDGERRELVSDKKLLLREAKDVSLALTTSASIALALLVAAWIGALGWGVARVGDIERTAGYRARSDPLPRDPSPDRLPLAR